MNSLTNVAEALGIAAITGAATRIKLYQTTSVPVKNGVQGVDFIEVINGHGYVTNGQAVVGGNWTASVVAGKARRTLATFSWSASGGQIPNVAGAYLVDGSGNVLAWWERSPVTVQDGGTLDLTGLYIG